MTTTQEKIAELDAEIAELEEYRETVLADKAGKKIQMSGPLTGEWEKSPNPTWHPDFKYRVAPEPITCWALIWDTGFPTSYHKTEKKAESAREGYSACNSKIIKMVEEI